ncbi:unnamed protein product [Rhizophagus irregularis]|nr:unnamed protein product [Rhizophagus irregularis]
MKHLKLRILQTNEMFEQQMRKHKPPVEFIETHCQERAIEHTLFRMPIDIFQDLHFLPDLPSRDNPDHYETFANMLNKSTEVLKIRTQMLTQARNVRQISDGYGLGI